MRAAFMVVAVVAFAVSACQTTGPEPSSDRGELPAVGDADAYLEDDEPEAQVFDLTGRWTSTIRAIYSGEEGPHAYEVEEGGVNIDNLRFSMEVEVQDGQLFYGTVSSTSAAEQFLGAMRSDGTSAIYTTSRGGGTMYFLAPDQIESCHAHGSPTSMLATCSILVRAK